MLKTVYTLKGSKW